MSVRYICECCGTSHPVLNMRCVTFGKDPHFPDEVHDVCTLCVNAIRGYLKSDKAGGMWTFASKAEEENQ